MITFRLFVISGHHLVALDPSSDLHVSIASDSDPRWGEARLMCGLGDRLFIISGKELVALDAGGDLHHTAASDSDTRWEHARLMFGLGNRLFIITGNDLVAIDAYSDLHHTVASDTDPRWGEARLICGLGDRLFIISGKEVVAVDASSDLNHTAASDTDSRWGHARLMVAFDNNRLFIISGKELVALEHNLNHTVASDSDSRWKNARLMCGEPDSDRLFIISGKEVVAVNAGSDLHHTAASDSDTLWGDARLMCKVLNRLFILTGNDLVAIDANSDLHHTGATDSPWSHARLMSVTFNQPVPQPQPTVASSFVCRIALFEHQDKVIHLPGGIQDNGSPVQLWPMVSDDDPNHANQEWNFDPVGDGYYVIALAANPNKVLNVPGGPIKNETAIQIWDRSHFDDPWQQWTLYFVNGVFTLEPRATPGYVLWHFHLDAAPGDKVAYYRYYHEQNVVNGEKWVLRIRETPAAMGLSLTSGPTSASKLILEFCPQSRPGTPRTPVQLVCRTAEVIGEVVSGSVFGIIQAIGNVLQSDVICPDPTEPGGGPECYPDPDKFGEEPEDHPEDHHGDDDDNDDNDDHG